MNEKIYKKQIKLISIDKGEIFSLICLVSRLFKLFSG